MAGGDQADVAAQDPLQHRGDQRVVGAAEDHGVDVGSLQRRAIGAHRLDHALVERKAVLDYRREVVRLDLDHLQPRPCLCKRPAVCPALDRGRRRENPDPAGLGDRGGDLGLRLDHADDLDPGSPAISEAVSRPAAVAELQAMTSSFAPRSSK